jgi:hypothetical protein
LGFCYVRAVPTVLRFDGLRVVIYLNDHAPALFTSSAPTVERYSC